MIAMTKPFTAKQRIDREDAPFEQMLPQIQRQAWRAFRSLNREAREELVAEVVANAFVAYRRLLERDKIDLVYPSVLAKFAIRQVREGRKVGTKLNIRDVTSRHCQRSKDVRVQSLSAVRCTNGRWQEVVVEDRTATPADIAAIRIDFTEWLQTLTQRQREVATTLSSGESTKAAAHKFGISRGRISQYRKELKAAWEIFQGELPNPVTKT